MSNVLKVLDSLYWAIKLRGLFEYEEWLNEKTERLSKWMNGRIIEWMNEWVNEYIIKSERMNEWITEWQQ